MTETIRSAVARVPVVCDGLHAMRQYQVGDAGWRPLPVSGAAVVPGPNRFTQTRQQAGELAGRGERQLPLHSRRQTTSTKRRRRVDANVGFAASISSGPQAAVGRYGELFRETPRGPTSQQVTRFDAARLSSAARTRLTGAHSRMRRGCRLPPATASGAGASAVRAWSAAIEAGQSRWCGSKGCRMRRAVFAR